MTLSEIKKFTKECCVNGEAGFDSDWPHLIHVKGTLNIEALAEYIIVSEFKNAIARLRMPSL
jgi:hypothetical protein